MIAKLYEMKLLPNSDSTVSLLRPFFSTNTEKYLFSLSFLTIVFEVTSSKSWKRSANVSHQSWTQFGSLKGEYSDSLAKQSKKNSYIVHLRTIQE